LKKKWKDENYNLGNKDENVKIENINYKIKRKMRIIKLIVKYNN